MSYRFTNCPNPPELVTYIGTCTSKSNGQVAQYPSSFYLTENSHSIRDVGGKRAWIETPFGTRLAFKPVIIEAWDVTNVVRTPTSRVDSSTSY